MRKLILCLVGFVVGLTLTSVIIHNIKSTSLPNSYKIEKVYASGERLLLRPDEKLVAVPVNTALDAECIWPAYDIQCTIDMGRFDLIVESGPFLLTTTPGFDGKEMGGKRVYSVEE